MSDLYATDYIAWTEQQADVLRRAAAQGSNLALDWEHLIEEVLSLGASERRAVGSQVRRIIEHLLKLEFSPAVNPRAGWRESIIDARAEIESLVGRDPGLAPRLPDIIAEEWPRALRSVPQMLRAYRETEAAAAVRRLGPGHYGQAQILGAWFPDDGDGD